MDSSSILSHNTYLCSLCCEEMFHSKAELIAHLSLMLSKLSCPICKDYFNSLQHLINHLMQNACEAPNMQIKFDNDKQMEHSETLLTNFPNGEVVQENLIHHTSQTDDVEDNSEIGKMYGEYLSKGLKTPEICISQSNNGQFIILSQDDLSEAVVTKNHDGTISLTTAEQETNTKTERTVNQTENEVNDQNDMEVYSCNTCGVSFTSVLEHIQTYHKYEEVVVEEPMDDNVAEYTSVQDNQLPRRVITDTGDIVEETESQQPMVTQEVIKQEVEEVPKRQLPKRYIKVEKMCDRVVKNIKAEKNNVDYHKVVVKHVKTSKGIAKVYSCIHCNINVSSLNELASKQCKKVKYQCPHCEVAYENLQSLCAHMKIHKAKMEKYQCPHCDVSYENSKSLCAHMKVHKIKMESTEVKLTFDCKICNTNFPTNKSLKLHMRMHAPVKIRQIEPPLNAEKGEQSNDKFLCSICDKLIPIDYRAVHQNSHKTDGDKLNCDICNKKFTTPEYLEMHMGVHNLERITLNNPDKELPYKCLYCHRKFARPHEKVKHERIHTGEKPHACEICGKSFRVSYCLTLHMRTHTGARPYACPHCPKRFKAHSVYNHHLLTHSEVRAYKCPFCPKAFKTLVQLAGHKNSHTKPFSCQQCNRPFASLYAVRVHTETHNKQNNLKFACEHCGATYARVSALRDHVKQAHDAPQQTPEAIHKSPTTNEPSNAVITETVPEQDDNISKTYEIHLELASNELIV